MEVTKATDENCYYDGAGGDWGMHRKMDKKAGTCLFYIS